MTRSCGDTCPMCSPRRRAKRPCSTRCCRGSRPLSGGSSRSSSETADESEPVRLTAVCVVTHEAMLRAVPSLDLVLTPNGFGIVSNQNVAPASRDRVARLIASLETSRDNSIEQLIGYLFRIEEWWQSATRQWFTATLFPNIDLANLCGYNDHRWANYLGLRSKCIDIEQRIAEEFISPEQLAVLREEVFSMSWDFSLTASCHTQIIERLRSVIVSALQGNTLNIQSLRDIVDFMRKHDEQFPEFRSSRTYKLFEPPIFENKKGPSHILVRKPFTLHITDRIHDHSIPPYFKYS